LEVFRVDVEATAAHVADLQKLRGIQRYWKPDDRDLSRLILPNLAGGATSRPEMKKPPSQPPR
jgi:hypothetical protein